MRRCCLVTVLGLAACQPKGNVPGLFEFSCADGKKFYVDMSGTPRDPVAKVHWEGQAVALQPVVTASGTKFSDGVTTYWNKGDEASLHTSAGRYESCKVAR